MLDFTDDITDDDMINYDRDSFVEDYWDELAF